MRIGNEDGLEVGLEFGFSVGVELVGCDEGSKLLCAVGMLVSCLENVGLRKGDLVRSFLGGDGDSLCFKLGFDEFMMLGVMVATSLGFAECKADGANDGNCVHVPQVAGQFLMTIGKRLQRHQVSLRPTHLHDLRFPSDISNLLVVSTQSHFLHSRGQCCFTSIMLHRKKVFSEAQAQFFF